MSRYEELLLTMARDPDWYQTGQEFADASLFISCATSLAVLHIKKHVEDGKEVTPTLEQNDGSIW
jgi:hypothetical protein